VIVDLGGIAQFFRLQTFLRELLHQFTALLGIEPFVSEF
jgi:hypothetical protein